MRTIGIQAFEDRDSPAGGFVVIRLAGTTSLRPDTTFVLTPTDGGDSTGWPNGPQRPIEVRAKDGAIDLIVGPLIVANPMLVPGTSVRIELENDGIGGDFIWPDVTPPARPRRRMILPPPPRSAETPVPQAQPSMRATPEAPARMETTTRPPQEQRMPDMAEPSTTRISAGGRVAAPIERDPQPVPQSRAAVPTDQPVFYASARASLAAGPTGGGDTQRSFKDTLPRSRRGAAAVAIAGLLALQGTAFAIYSARTPAAPPISATSISSGPAAAQAADPLFDLLSTGEVAPSGTRSNGLAPARMLELAHASLFGEGAARDTGEAAYWLKRYAAASLGDERGRRVLTQLGSTFATPSQGAPDYGKARQAWEMAAAFGDPVAMCFIIKLHEAGLAGAASDRTMQTLWAERARAAGGCRPVAK